MNRQDIKPIRPKTGLSRLKGVKNILAIAANKGGVGKSTVAYHLALGLMALGARVGLVDADIYGPSLPVILGEPQKALTNDNKEFVPIVSNGLQAMSIGYLIDEKDALIWRGPMATNALMQIITKTAWEDLDYLIVDMPPGTGDIPLTLTQKVPLSAAVVVTTPHELALKDATKAVRMFQKLEIPVLGLVENMSFYQCSHCGNLENIFGEGTLEEVAILGKLMLTKNMQDNATNFSTIIKHILQNLEKLPRDLSIAMEVCE